MLLKPLQETVILSTLAAPVDESGMSTSFVKILISLAYACRGLGLRLSCFLFCFGIFIIICHVLVSCLFSFPTFFHLIFNIRAVKVDALITR